MNNNRITIFALLFVLISLCLICDASELEEQQSLQRKSGRTRHQGKVKKPVAKNQSKYERETPLKNNRKQHLLFYQPKDREVSSHSRVENQSVAGQEFEGHLVRKFHSQRRDLRVFTFFCRIRLRRCEKKLKEELEACASASAPNNYEDDVKGNFLFGFLQGSCRVELDRCEARLASSECYKVPPKGTEVNARVFIQTDEFPEELTWGIEDITNGVRGLYNGFGEPSPTSEDIIIKTGNDYEVTVTDNYGDGFCCPGGSFEISIDLIGNGDYYPVYQLSGNYGLTTKHRFAVVDACNNPSVPGHTDGPCTSSSECCTNLCADGKCMARCPEGYALSIDGTQCEDIDECALGIADCGFSECFNTRGSYQCKYQTPEIGTQVAAFVVIEFDDYPTELSWSINEFDNGAFTEIYFGAGTAGTRTSTANIELTAGKRYEAVLEDSFGDGFCCPDGSFQVVVGIGGNLNVSLVNVVGNYSSPSITSFTLEEICNDELVFGFTGSLCNGGSSCCTGTCLNGECSSCPEGYALNADSATCEDVNECDNTDNCGDFDCKNTEGGFQCFYRIPPVGSVVPGKITIVPDSFPDEFSWRLFDTTANFTLLRAGTGDENDIPIVLEVGRRYAALLLDKGRDGFCCPAGSYTVSVNLGNDVYLPVASVEGNYGGLELLPFTVFDACNGDSILGSNGSNCTDGVECCSGICTDGVCINGCLDGFRFNSEGICENINECTFSTGACGSLPCTDTEGSYECEFQLASYTRVNGTIDIESDDHPEDFSWVINDVTNASVFASGFGRTDKQEIDISLEIGAQYEAVLQDSFGDGFGAPTGSFVVSVRFGSSRAFKLVDVRDDYGSTKEVSFSVPDICGSEFISGRDGSTCSSGTDCCGGICLNGKCITRCDDGFEFNENQSSCIDVDECATGNVCGSAECKNFDGSYACFYQLPLNGTAVDGKVTIIPDDYPSDFSYVIKDLTSGETTLSGDAFDNSSKVFEIPTQFVVGNSYEATLTDIAGDGFGDPDGSFAIYAEVDGKIVSLAEVSGNYGNFAVLPFSVANFCDSEDIYGSNNSTCSDASDCCSNFCAGGKCVVGCPPGYKLNGSDCEDINECTLMTDNCGSNTCINTPGGFECVYQVPANGIELNGRVDIIYDWYPFEFSWAIDDISGNNLYNGAGRNGSTTEEVDISLIVGDSYKAVLTDSASDGFCCDGGSFTISVEIETGVFLEIAKVSDTGRDDNFGPLKEIEFSVASICSDSANAGSNESPCSSPNECCSGVCTDGVCKAG